MRISDNNSKWTAPICWARTICQTLYTLLLGHRLLTTPLCGWCFFLVYIFQMGALSLERSKSLSWKSGQLSGGDGLPISPSIRPSPSCLPSEVRPIRTLPHPGREQALHIMTTFPSKSQNSNLFYRLSCIIMVLQKTFTEIMKWGTHPEDGVCVSWCRFLLCPLHISSLPLSFLPFFPFPLSSPLPLCFPSSVILPPSFPPTPLWSLPLFPSDFILLLSSTLLLQWDINTSQLLALEWSFSSS